MWGHYVIEIVIISNSCITAWRFSLSLNELFGGPLGGSGKHKPMHRELYNLKRHVENTTSASWMTPLPPGLRVDPVL
jgi:hypothetical protein